MKNLNRNAFYSPLRSADETGLFLDSRKAEILASSSGFSDLPNAGMLTPSFTITMAKPISGISKVRLAAATVSLDEVAVGTRLLQTSAHVQRLASRRADD